MDTKTKLKEGGGEKKNPNFLPSGSLVPDTLLERKHQA